MSRSLDALIHLHLEGELTTAEAAELSARLAADPAAAKRLAEMAFDQAALRGLLEARPARRRLRAILPWAAAALLLLAVGAALLVGPGERPSTPVPAAPASHRGPLRGTVLSRTEGGLVRLRVTEPGGHPLAGRTIHVGPGFQRTDAGDVVPHKTHPVFLKRLEPGQELTIDVREVGEDVFVIGDLTPEQNEAVKKDLKKIRDKDVKKPAEREGDREK